MILLRAALKLIASSVLLFCSPFFAFAIYVAARTSNVKNGLFWGHTPIINNKYWSLAMREVGYKSCTLMSEYYGGINRKEDFDLYCDDLYAFIRPKLVRQILQPWFVLLYMARHARVFHMPFYGGALRNTALWRAESYIYRLAGIKTVAIPYGGDIYMYSDVFDPCIRHGLLLSYPEAARRECFIRSRVNYWVRHADVVLMGFTLEGVARWDVPVGNMLCIDTREWQAKENYSMANGFSEPVKVLHNPNHTGVKGSEFILNAVNVLREKGLKIELVLLQGVQNSEVKKVMQSVDVHADQLILPGYGMSAIEAMASGLPVIANLTDARYTTIFKRFSFLGECPIYPSCPERIVEDLEALVVNPELRIKLGVAGRDYVEKYHSFKSAQYLFGAVYDKLIHGKDVDLMNLYHPLKARAQAVPKT